MTLAEAARLLGLPPGAAASAVEDAFACRLADVEQALLEAGSVEERGELQIRQRELEVARTILLAPPEAHHPGGGPAHVHHGVGVRRGLAAGAAVVLAVVVMVAMIKRQDPEPAGRAISPPPQVDASAVDVAAPEQPETATRPPEPATRYHVVVDAAKGALVCLWRQPLLVLPAARVDEASALAARLEQLQRKVGGARPEQLDNTIQVGLDAPVATPLLFALEDGQVNRLLEVDREILTTVGWQDDWALANHWRSLLTDGLRLAAGEPASGGLLFAAGTPLATVTEGEPDYTAFRDSLEQLDSAALDQLQQAPWTSGDSTAAQRRPDAALATAERVEVQTNYGAQLALRKRPDAPGNLDLLLCGEPLQPVLLWGDWLQVRQLDPDRVGWVVHRDAGGSLVHPPKRAAEVAAARVKRLLAERKWQGFREGDAIMVSSESGVESRAEPCACSPTNGRLSYATRITVRGEFGDWLEVGDVGEASVFIRWRAGEQVFVRRWLNPPAVAAGKWVRRAVGVGGMSASFPEGWNPTKRTSSGWTQLEYRDTDAGVQMMIEARPQTGDPPPTAAKLWEDREAGYLLNYGRAYRTVQAQAGERASIATFELKQSGVTWQKTYAVAVGGGHAYAWLIAGAEGKLEVWMPVLEKFQDSIDWGQ